MAISDFRTNARLRQILARHWVDMQGLRYGSFRGTVRLTGELNHVSGRSLESDTTLIEVLEAEVRRIPGVRAVYFDFANWVRDSDGRWTEIESSSLCDVREGQVLEAVEPDAEDSESDTEPS